MFTIEFTDNWLKNYKLSGDQYAISMVIRFLRNDPEIIDASIKVIDENGKEVDVANFLKNGWLTWM